MKMTDIRKWLILFFSLFPFFIYGQEVALEESGDMPQYWQSDSMFMQQLPIDDLWWKGFNDPQLDSLISRAVINNNDLLIASDRVRMAKATLRSAQGNFYPTVDLSAGWTKERNSSNTTQRVIPGLDETTDYASASVAASWELDLFGSIRQRVKSQKGLYQASQEEYNAAMVSLCAQVATVYASLRTLQQQYMVADKNIRSQEAILRITEVRYNTGLASRLDVAQAKSVYYSTKASLPLLQSQIIQYINSLAVLIGVYPDALRPALSEPKPMPEYMRLVSVGIPMNLLRQRPDVRSAERTVAANAASVGASRSDYLPKFYLKGTIGFAAHDMDKFFNHNSLTYQIAPVMTWNLFQGTQRFQATRLAKAQLDESIRQYNQSVLTAVQEVDNAMNNYTGSIQQVVALKEVVYQGEETLRLSLDLYKRGLGTFQNVLDAQRSLLSYENSLVSAQGSTLGSLINLYQALGGGWINEDDNLK